MSLRDTLDLYEFITRSDEAMAGFLKEEGIKPGTLDHQHLEREIDAVAQMAGMGLTDEQFEKVWELLEQFGDGYRYIINRSARHGKLKGDRYIGKDELFKRARKLREQGLDNNQIANALADDADVKYKSKTILRYLSELKSEEGS
jgi:hypothetical protein